MDKYCSVLLPQWCQCHFLRRKPWRKRLLFIEVYRLKRQLRKDRVLLRTASFIALSCKCASFLDLCVCIFGVIFFLLSQELILFGHASEPIYRPCDIPSPAWVTVNAVEQMPRCSISRGRKGHLCLPVEMRTAGLLLDRSCMSILGIRKWDGICAAFLGCVPPHSALGNFIWMWLFAVFRILRSLIGRSKWCYRGVWGSFHAPPMYITIYMLAVNTVHPQHLWEVVSLCCSGQPRTEAWWDAFRSTKEGTH